MALPNIQSYENLGGELADYKPVEDPTTDLSAEASNELRADFAASTRTCDKAWFCFTVNSGDLEIAPGDFDAVYGNADIYKPTGSYNSTGNYTFTLPASVIDARGNTQYLNLKTAIANIGETGFGAQAKVTSANTVDVYISDVVGASIGDPSTSSVKVTVIVK